MALTDEQRIDRLHKRLAELELWTVRAASRSTAGPSTASRTPSARLADARRRRGVSPIPRPTVPADWPLEQTRLDLDLGGEGLVRIAYPGGAASGFGLDPNHQRFPLQARAFRVSAECVARLPFGVPNRGAAAGAGPASSWLDSDLIDFVLLLPPGRRDRHGARRARGGARRCWPPPRRRSPASTGRRRPLPMSPASPRAPRSQRIWQLPADLDPAPPGLDDAASAPRSRPRPICWRRGCAPCATATRQIGALALTGHAHIDLAWLWPLAETRRKANRTFHTMIGLMDRHPGFRFNQSTAQLYAFLEEDDPALFAAHQGEGGGGPVGADRRACGSSPTPTCRPASRFVRQLLYGQRYFEKTFGKRHRVCWLPDCFGFSPALPQLLQPGRRHQLLHHQGELVRDQPRCRSTSSGGRGSTAAACSPTPSTTRSAATTPRSAPAPSSRPGGTSAASIATPRACSPSATATAAAARPRRCSTRQRQLRRLPGGAVPAPGQRRRLVRRRCTSASATIPTCRSGSARCISSCTAAP